MFGPRSHRIASGAFAPLVALGVITVAALFVDNPPVTIAIALGAIVITVALLRSEQTARRRIVAATAELERRATTDPLTGLANRTALLERAALALSDDNSALVPAVLYLDLDKFKLINDSLGHAAGDHLLVEVARRLVAACGEDDVIARIGGDEFVILTAAAGRSDVEKLASEIDRSLSVPIELDGEEHFTRASVGISLAGVDSTPETLLQFADAAMYAAKHGERRRLASFTPDLLARADDRLHMINDLRRAVARNEFQLVYQPIVRMATGETIGYESLLRWHHPTRGLLTPATFLPIASDIGLVGELGQWVRSTAIAEATRWAHDANPPWIAVNVSGRELADDRFADEVMAQLAEHDCPPRRLVLEVNESDIAHERGCAGEQLAALRREGVQIAVDDFGSGSSGLGQLRAMPVDLLKLDQSLVVHGAEGDADRAVLRAVLDVGRAFGLTMIAEGVENATQARVLAELGCHFAQGWHFGTDVSSAEAGISVMLASMGQAVGGR